MQITNIKIKMIWLLPLTILLMFVYLWIDYFSNNDTLLEKEVYRLHFDIWQDAQHWKHLMGW